MGTLLPLLVGLIVGIAFAFFDRKRGLFWYRSWYKLTHKDGLPEDSQHTFLFQQPFSKRLVPAVTMTLAIGWLFYVAGNINFFELLLYLALMLIGMMLSFYLFPFFTKSVQPQIKQIRNTIERIDEIEQSIKDKNVTIPIESKDEKPEEQKKDDSDKKDDKDKGDDWRKGVKDFLDK
ncbi:MAG: hypothetical protein GC181_09750 [Bacteroidetes bacterium]|nr:hypothetical protein [Bacteroidota bacterium]